jgi:exonuclease SbcC
MIKKVILENFQAHEHSIIEFSEGINVICGASDQGKSSVIRAIRWVLENRPSGFAFKREGAKGPTRVTLEFDNGKIVKTRSETENSYKVYVPGKKPVEFKALRTDVPDEVKTLSQFGPYNIQYQFGSSFLLDDSPGDVAKKLNNLSGVAIIDDILKETNSRIRAEKAKESATTDLLNDLKKTKAGFRNLKKLEKLVAEMETVNTEIEEYKNYQSILTGHISNLKRLESMPVVDTDKADSYITEARKKAKDYKDYSDAYNNLRGNIASLTRIEKQLGKFKNFKAADGLVSEARTALAALVDTKNRASKLETHLAKLREYEEGWKASVRSIKKAIDDLAKFKQENKVCPVCSKKW